MHVVVSPEGQRSCEEEIWYSQIQDEGVGEGFQILKLDQHHEDQDVAKDAEDHHNGEKHWSEDRSKLDDTCFVAEFIVVIIIDVRGWVKAGGGSIYGIHCIHFLPA